MHGVETSLKAVYSMTLLPVTPGWSRMLPPLTSSPLGYSVTGGELFEDIVAREYYSEADAR